MTKYYQFMMLLGMSIQAATTGMLMQNNSITVTPKQQYSAAMVMFFIAMVLFLFQSIIETMIRKSIKKSIDKAS